MSKSKKQLKPIDKPIFSYFDALYLSFFSRQLYVDVGKRWRGMGFLYLLLVLAILVIPFSLIVGANFNKFFNQQLIRPLLQLPTIYVQNGEASIDKPMPYMIKNEKQEVVLIVDTTGKVNDFTSEYPKLSILINKDKMSYKLPTAQFFNLDEEHITTHVPVVQYFNKDANSVFDGKKMVSEGTLTGLKYASQLMVYPLVITILFSFFLILFPIITLLAQVFTRIFWAFKIPFFTASRLLIVSSTPMMLVLFVFLTGNVVFAGMGIILLFLVAAFYSFALKSFKSESQQVAAS